MYFKLVNKTQEFTRNTLNTFNISSDNVIDNDNEIRLEGNLIKFYRNSDPYLLGDVFIQELII